MTDASHLIECVTSDYFDLGNGQSTPEKADVLSFHTASTGSGHTVVAATLRPELYPSKNA
jgi:hypothetical protein